MFYSAIIADPKFTDYIRQFTKNVPKRIMNKKEIKVKLPRIIRRSKEALSKEDVIDILNSCSDIKLKTYAMLLARNRNACY